jgi:hypothetical protein
MVRKNNFNCHLVAVKPEQLSGTHGRGVVIQEAHPAAGSEQREML